MCGEQSIDGADYVMRRGSSPRVRGTAGICVTNPLFNGIIPACAGNSAFDKDGYACKGDHPRVCGEQMVSKGQIDFQTGSSPRVRGTAVESQKSATDVGIIPACAGNSSYLRCGLIL